MPNAPRRPGRPPTAEGPASHVTLRLPPDLLARIDAAAAIADQTRSEWIRARLARALRRR